MYIKNNKQKETEMSYEDKEKAKWDKIKEEKQRSINIQTAFNQACEDIRLNDKEEIKVQEFIKQRTKLYYQILKELHKEI